MFRLKLAIIFPTVFQAPNFLENLQFCIFEPVEPHIIIVKAFTSPVDREKFYQTLSTFEDWHKRMTILEQERPEGIVPAYNAGFREAHSLGAEYIGLMDDSIWIHDHPMFTRMIAILEKHPEYGVLFPNHIYNPNPVWPFKGATLESKKYYEDLGPYDEHFIPAWYEDTDRLYSSYDRGYSPKCIVDIRVFHPGGTTTQGPLVGPRLDQGRNFKYLIEKHKLCTAHPTIPSGGWEVWIEGVKELEAIESKTPQIILDGRGEKWRREWEASKLAHSDSSDSASLVSPPVK